MAERGVQGLMQSAALYCTDLAMRREIAGQVIHLSRGLWVLRFCATCAFWVGMLRVLFGFANAFRGTVPGGWMLLQAMTTELADALEWLTPAIAISLVSQQFHTWLTKRREAMLADSHSARIELLNYLS